MSLHSLLAYRAVNGIGCQIVAKNEVVQAYVGGKRVLIKGLPATISPLDLESTKKFLNSGKTNFHWDGRAITVGPIRRERGGNQAAHLAMELEDSVNRGERDLLLQKCAELLKIADREQTSDPLLVVQHLLVAISAKKAYWLPVATKIALAKTLQRYADLAYLHSDDGQKKDLDKSVKTYDQQFLSTIYSLDDLIPEENQLYFSLVSAWAGLRALQTVDNKFQSCLTQLAAKISQEDLENATILLDQLLIEKRKTYSEVWYADLLLLRLLAPLAPQSEKIFDQVVDLLHGGKSWALIYGSLQLLTSVAGKSAFPTHQKNAFDLLASYSTFSKLSFDNGRVREGAIKGLIELRFSPLFQEKIANIFLERRVYETDKRIKSHFEGIEKTPGLKQQWKALWETKDFVKELESREQELLSQKGTLSSKDFEKAQTELEAIQENIQALSTELGYNTTTWKLPLGWVADTAINYCSQAVASIRIALGGEDEAIRLDNLGVAALEERDYTAAIGYHTQAISIGRKTLGDNHPDVAKAWFNLGNAFYELEDYLKAATAYSRAIEIENTLDDYPNRHLSLNNLGMTFHGQADYASAVDCHKKALTIRIQTYGVRHPATSASLSNLAASLFAQENYSEAVKYYNQAIDIDKEVLGGNDIAVATNLHNLAAIFYVQGDYAKAVDYFTQTLHIKRVVYGNAHPSTKQTMQNLQTAQAWLRRA